MDSFKVPFGPVVARKFKPVVQAAVVVETGAPLDSDQDLPDSREAALYDVGQL
jgi:hypothetical protein